MDRRKFLLSLGLGGCAALSGDLWRHAGAATVSGNLPSGLLSGLPAIPSEVWQTNLPHMTSSAAGGLRSAGQQVAGLLRGLPRMAGSDNLQQAFGGALWRPLASALPRHPSEITSKMRGQWGSPSAQSAFDGLSGLNDGSQFLRQMATQASMPWSQVEQVALRLGQTPDLRVDAIPLPSSFDSAVDTIANSSAVQQALSPLGSWRSANDVDLPAAMQGFFAALYAHPNEWATIIEHSFSGGAALLSPGMEAVNLPTLFQAGAPLAARSMTDMPASVDDVLKRVGIAGFILAEMPFNAIVIGCDCKEALAKHDPDRLKLLAEIASFVGAYGATWAYRDPPIDSYTNGMWSLTSFGEDIALEFVKRRRKELGDETLEMIWGGVGFALLLAYLIGLYANPSRPAWAIESVTADDKKLSQVIPMVVWALLTKVICRLAAPLSNRYAWKLYFAPAIWMTVYLIGCACEMGLWAADLYDVL